MFKVWTNERVVGVVWPANHSTQTPSPTSFKPEHSAHSLILVLLGYCGHFSPAKMSSHPKEEPKKEIPVIIVDPSTGKKYQRGKFLGKVRGAEGKGLMVVALGNLYYFLPSYY